MAPRFSVSPINKIILQQNGRNTATFLSTTYISFGCESVSWIRPENKVGAQVVIIRQFLKQATNLKSEISHAKFSLNFLVFFSRFWFIIYSLDPDEGSKISKSNQTFGF